MIISHIKVAINLITTPVIAREERPRHKTAGAMKQSPDDSAIFKNTPSLRGGTTRQSTGFNLLPLRLPHRNQCLF